MQQRTAWPVGHIQVHKVHAKQRVTERGGRLLLVCPHPLILKILHLAGLSSRLAAVPTLEEVLTPDVQETAG
ncbi:hypothetical protein [Streptomyces violaceusniger]|uniref:STAS domain-containing protein n=1 Tax=Streptomyces violaceusniger TaxID=68280 RepID=A0A4D4KPM6_STRVO|nr:hypothetical protein SVIO_007570 [Streptomyces violaceusniger]